MTASTEPASQTPAPTHPEAKPERIGRLLRWASRITSIPIMALVLTSLVPAITNFNVSARDDKAIAIALVGTAVGLLLGWKWAGIGGVITLASVGVMLSQGDSWLYPDPFSVAFGLQGLLFLISALVGASAHRTEDRGLGWATKGAIGILALVTVLGAASILRGPGPTPVPKDREAYVGTWKDGTGFKLEISADGRAVASQEKGSKMNPMNSPVGPGESKSFLLYFRGDDRLELTTGTLGELRVYHIDRVPHAEGKQIKMVINGSDPYIKSSGMALVKESAK